MSKEPTVVHDPTGAVAAKLDAIVARTMGTPIPTCEKCSGTGTFTTKKDCEMYCPDCLKAGWS